MRKPDVCCSCWYLPLSSFSGMAAIISDPRRQRLVFMARKTFSEFLSTHSRTLSFDPVVNYKKSLISESRSNKTHSNHHYCSRSRRRPVGTALVAATLKKIGFFCFPIKHSTHTVCQCFPIKHSTHTMVVAYALQDPTVV